VPGDLCAAGGRAQQRRQNADRGGLPGAVRPEQTEDLAGADSERDPAQSLDLAEPDDQPVD
jgi:hypothetical protein